MACTEGDYSSAQQFSERSLGSNICLGWWDQTPEAFAWFLLGTHACLTHLACLHSHFLYQAWYWSSWNCSSLGKRGFDGQGGEDPLRHLFLIKVPWPLSVMGFTARDVLQPSCTLSTSAKAQLKPVSPCGSSGIWASGVLTSALWLWATGPSLSHSLLLALHTLAFSVSGCAGPPVTGCSSMSLPGSYHFSGWKICGARIPATQIMEWMGPPALFLFTSVRWVPSLALGCGKVWLVSFAAEAGIWKVEKCVLFLHGGPVVPIFIIFPCS